MPLNTLRAMVAHASIESSKPKVELDSHVDTCAVGDNCIVIHDHNKRVNVYSWDSKNGHISAKTIDAAVGYQDPQSENKFIFMIRQAICINGLENHLLCPMQCYLACISAKSPSF